MYFNRKSGFVRTVLIILIAVIALSYFGVDLKAIIESPESQGNLGYLWGLVVTFWNKFLAAPISYLWNDIFVDILWESFKGAMENVKGGGGVPFDNLPKAP